MPISPETRKLLSVMKRAQDSDAGAAHEEKLAGNDGYLVRGLSTIKTIGLERTISSPWFDGNTRWTSNE